MAENTITLKSIDVSGDNEDIAGIDFSKLSKEQKLIHNKIVDEAERQNVDPDLAVTVGWIENKFKPVGVSSAGALGPMQIMPANAKGLGVKVEDLKNPDTNIKLGVQILKENLDRYDGNVRAALVAYNGSPYRAGIFLKNNENPDVLKPETQNYLMKAQQLYPRMTENFATSDSDESDNPFAYDMSPSEEMPLEGDSPFGDSEALPEHIANFQPQVPEKDMSEILLERGSDAMGDVVENPAMATAGLASGLLQKFGTMPNEATPSPFQQSKPQAPMPQTMAPDPNARVIQGGVEDGMTGRSRQGYNDITSLRAQQARESQNMVNNLIREGKINPGDTQRLVSQAGIGGATPSGVLAPQNALDDLTKRLRDEATAKAKRSPLQRLLGQVKSIPEDLVGLSSRFPVITNTLGGIGAGLSARDFKERMDRGDIPGMAVSGLNTVAGGLSMIPALPPTNPLSIGLDTAKGLGMAGELIGLPLELAYQKYRSRNPLPNVKEIDKKKPLKKAEGGPVVMPMSLRNVYFHRKARGGSV
jgi:hypothetical protein